MEGQAPVTGEDVTAYKKDFWSQQNQKYAKAHFRMQKAVRLINRRTGSQHCDLLDVGCGPATLAGLLRPGIAYHGIDIAIPRADPKLREIDILETPITFDQRSFDLIVALGLFEYMTGAQAQKLEEIADILAEDGTFIVSYVNFDHRKPSIYWFYNNVQPFNAFRAALADVFTIVDVIPTSHNWSHSEPNRRWVRAINMHINAAMPIVSPKLAVEYFVVCKRRSAS